MVANVIASKAVGFESISRPNVVGKVKDDLGIVYTYHISDITSIRIFLTLTRRLVVYSTPENFVQTKYFWTNMKIIS